MYLSACCRGCQYTPDGPRGPAFELKTGTVLMARMGGAPLLPLGYAADRAWVLDTWDRFTIPRPFSKVVIAVGDPDLLCGSE